MQGAQRRSGPAPADIKRGTGASVGRMLRITGLLIAITGIAHFVAPQLFKDITKVAFPEDTDEWIKRNGAIETAIGSTIAIEKTRKLGLLGLGAYTGWLAFNGAKNS